MPDGAARRRQKWTLALCYLISFLILIFVCLPVVLLLRDSDETWPTLGYVLIFIVTLLLALIPLLLTAGYNLAWLKLRGKLAALLPRAGE